MSRFIAGGLRCAIFFTSQIKQTRVSRYVVTAKLPVPVVFWLELTTQESAEKEDLREIRGIPAGVWGGQLNANRLPAVAFGSSARLL